MRHVLAAAAPALGAAMLLGQPAPPVSGASSGSFICCRDNLFGPVCLWALQAAATPMTCSHQASRLSWRSAAAPGASTAAAGSALLRRVTGQNKLAAAIGSTSVTQQGSALLRHIAQ